MILALLVRLSPFGGDDNICVCAAGARKPAIGCKRINVGGSAHGTPRSLFPICKVYSYFRLLSREFLVWMYFDPN